MSIFGATDTPLSDFWWSLLWVSNLAEANMIYVIYVTMYFLWISNIWQLSTKRFKPVQTVFVSNFWLNNYTVIIPIEISLVRNY